MGRSVVIPIGPREGHAHREHLLTRVISERLLLQGKWLFRAPLRRNKLSQLFVDPLGGTTHQFFLGLRHLWSYTARHRDAT